MKIVKKETFIEFDFDEVCDILIAHARRNIDPALDGVNPGFGVIDVVQDSGNFTIYVKD